MDFESSIPISLGDTICIKSHLDAPINRNKFDRIKICFHKPFVVSAKNNDPSYYKFLREMGSLFFSEEPYEFTNENVNYPFRDQFHILSDYGLEVQKPNLKHLLCKGTSLEVGEYVVVTTKLRYLSEETFKKISNIFFDNLNKISLKYKIVILGEKIVESCEEYNLWKIFGIYNELIQNLSSKNIIDLTIPALGVTSPILSQVQQDCLIMNEAKAVISLGVGGNFCMALGSNSNLISFREDEEPIANAIFDNKIYPKIFTSKNFSKFIHELKKYQ